MKLCAFQFHIDHHSQGNEGKVQETDGKNENKEQTTKMREWTLNSNSSADMDKSLPMNAATTEAISSVNQINDCISADPLETGLYNLRFYTLCDSPAFSINTHLLPIWGKERHLSWYCRSSF